MELTRIDLGREVLSIIESDFAGLYSGPLGISSIAVGQSAADKA